MTASRKPIGSDLAKVDAHVIQPHEYDDAPEWTEEDFARADLYQGDRLIRRGRPPLARPKEAVKIRLAPEVLDHFRAGRGRPVAHPDPREGRAGRGQRRL